MSGLISNRIYVAGLEGKVSVPDLRAYFGKFGEMTDVYIPKNHQTGQPKHFGFVTFANGESAQECLGISTHEINGQPIELKPCVAKDQMAPKGFGKGDAATPVVGMVGGAAMGPGMNMPLQPTLSQPGMGGLGLQALQQMQFQQQQQLQQQLLQQLMATMQQPQQFAQPVQMLPAQFGGCGLPAGGADLGSSFPAAQGSPQPLGMANITASDTSTAAGTAGLQTFQQQAPLMSNALTGNAAMPMLGMPSPQLGAPAIKANPGSVNQVAVPMLQAPSPQQHAATLSSSQQGNGEKQAQLQFNSVQVPAPADMASSSEGGALPAINNTSFSAAPTSGSAQDSTRYAPY